MILYQQNWMLVFWLLSERSSIKLNSTKLLLWPPICWSQHAITQECNNLLHICFAKCKNLFTNLFLGSNTLFTHRIVDSSGILICGTVGVGILHSTIIFVISAFGSRIDLHVYSTHCLDFPSTTNPIAALSL